ncbi:N-6 DNA methylase [Micromonospora sp. NPDC005206]|uniref:HsdM family class I SAM-dependent methyltransferase n=1 Tax=Micromonospora sp. NPDC005206 TaxID=3157022 RepID=UPI0033B0FD1B
MGDAFEYIIRKFNEAANETSGDHYTPRDPIRLLVDLLFAEKDADLTEAGIVRTLYDPTAGTGGILALAEEHLLAQNPDAKLSLYGQDYNSQSYAICKSDLLAKGHDKANIQGLGKIGPLRHAGQTDIAKALRHNARNHRRPLPLLGIT